MNPAGWKNGFSKELGNRRDRKKVLPFYKGLRGEGV